MLLFVVPLGNTQGHEMDRKKGTSNTRAEQHKTLKATRNINEALKWC